ncbi:hypothetical protein GF352_02915 [archaeon]|nr:hypothetical protein [archaeon]
MIKGFLGDLKIMTLVGMVLFFAGFLLSNLFVIALGLFSAGNGFALFCIVSYEYDRRKRL